MYMQALLDTLVKIKNKDSDSKFCYVVGICSNVHYVYDDGSGYVNVAGKELQNLMATWPKFSGDIEYPVPSTEPGKSAKDAYEATGNMWQGEYGALRQELLDHCIEQVQRQLAYEG